MKLLLINFFAILFLNIPLFAQHIYFCKSHTEDGQPIDADIVWDIRPFGQSIYILFDNAEQPITEPILYLLIDKQDGEEYHPFDSRAIHVENRASWVVQNYKLTDPGEYEVYIMGADRERLATARMTVNIKNTYSEDENSFSNLYYDNSDLVFCRLVVSGKPFDIRKTVSMSSGGSTYIYLKSNHPFNTEKLLVNIWRKRSGSFEYDEFIESKKYKMDPDWLDVFFIYKFKEPGRYKVSVYNDKETMIKFGFITVSE